MKPLALPKGNSAGFRPFAAFTKRGREPSCGPILTLLYEFYKTLSMFRKMGDESGDPLIFLKE
jgi:hypothetical protein